MNQPTSVEVELLIEKNLSKVWAGDKESDGIFRIIEILRWSGKLKMAQTLSTGDNLYIYEP